MNDDDDDDDNNNNNSNSSSNSSNSSSIPECRSSRFLRNICICLPTHMPQHLRRQSCLFSPLYEYQILLFKSSVTCQRPEATSEYCWIIKWNSKVLEIQLDRRRGAAAWWHCNMPYQEKRIFIWRLTQCKLWCPKACFSSAIWLINDFVSERQNLFLNEHCVVL